MLNKQSNLVIASLDSTRTSFEWEISDQMIDPIQRDTATSSVIMIKPWIINKLNIAHATKKVPFFILIFLNKNMIS